MPLQNAHVAFTQRGWQARQDVYGGPAASGRQLLDMAGDAQAPRPLLPHLLPDLRTIQHIGSAFIWVTEILTLAASGSPMM
jgi:hypothetical protein